MLIVRNLKLLTHHLPFPDRKISWSWRNRRRSLIKRRARAVRARTASSSFTSCCTAETSLASETTICVLLAGTLTFLLVRQSSQFFPRSYKERRLCSSVGIAAQRRRPSTSIQLVSRARRTTNARRIGSKMNYRVDVIQRNRRYSGPRIFFFFFFIKSSDTLNYREK